MSFTPIGCFSWLCGSKTSKKTKATKVKEKEEALPTVPTTGKYAFEATRETIDILRSFGGALPLPYANQVLTVALLLMETYEEVTIIEQHVKDLKNRIGSLMLIMVDGLKGKDPGNISPEVRQDIEKLGRDLEAIRQNLDQIAAQNRWLLVFFKNANQSTIDACLERLNNALQTFNVARTIHNGNILFEIQTRLQKVDATTGEMAEKVDQIHSWLKPKDGHNAHGPILEEMPVLPRLHGRDKVIEEIARIIATKPRPRVGILGAGGMGKTSVAVSVMDSEIVGQKYDSAYRFWVPCVGVTSPITFIQILSKSLRVCQDTGSPLKDLLDELKSSQKPRLILLDNFETALSLPDVIADGGRLSVEGILNQLANISHVAILVTIRSNTLPSSSIAWDLIPLDSVSQNDARAIFTSICPLAADDPALDTLLETLGHLPYAVTLMAKQAVASGLDAEFLLKEWKKSGPTSLSSDLRSEMNQSIEFSVKSRGMEDPDAQRLLAILSKLPSGTNQNHLKWWASSVVHLSSAIATLNKTALITQRRGKGTSPTLFVLPVVQSYLSENPSYNSPTIRRLVLEACCKFVLDHKSSPGDQHFKAHLGALALEQTNIQSILLAVSAETFSELGLASASAFEAMLAFSWYQYRTRYSPDLLNHILEISPASGGDNTPGYIAEAHFCLGKMYVRLGRHKEGCQELENARAQFRKLGTPSDRVRAGESTLEIVEACTFMDKPSEQILELIQEAQKELEGDPKGAERALMHLGYNYYWYEDDNIEALKHLKAAKDALEALGSMVDVAECAYFISRCYTGMGEFTKALEAAREAIGLLKSIGVNDPLSYTLIICARCHVQLGEYEDALVVLKEALSVSEQLGHPLAIAQVFELSGYAYAKKKDFAGARIAYEGAVSHFSNMDETEQTKESGGHCKYNLQRIEHTSHDKGDIELKPPTLY